jgi:4-hydroxy-tetrahydrodipicolinate synthase
MVATATISSTYEVRLDGLIPATVLPMTAGGAIDEPGLRRYIHWIAAQGPVALAVNADTGEGPSLEPRERVRVIEIAREETELPLVTGLFDPGEADAARRAGAEAALVFPVADDIVAYHRAIADRGIGVIAFQLQPALGGVGYSRDTIERVTALDGVIAIKEASFDRTRFAEAVQVSAKPVLTGNDNFVLESFELGCSGALVGFGAVHTAEQVTMIADWHRGAVDEARAASARLQPIADQLFAAPVSGYRRRIKELLVQQGVIDAAHMRPAPVRSAPR